MPELLIYACLALVAAAGGWGAFRMAKKQRRRRRRRADRSERIHLFAEPTDG
jgi:hypothetical protein